MCGHTYLVVCQATEYPWPAFCCVSLQPAGGATWKGLNQQEEAKGQRKVSSVGFTKEAKAQSRNALQDRRRSPSVMRSSHGEKSGQGGGGGDMSSKPFLARNGEKEQTRYGGKGKGHAHQTKV